MSHEHDSDDPGSALHLPEADGIEIRNDKIGSKEAFEAKAPASPAALASAVDGDSPASPSDETATKPSRQGFHLSKLQVTGLILVVAGIVCGVFGGNWMLHGAAGLGTLAGVWLLVLGLPLWTQMAAAVCGIGLGTVIFGVFDWPWAAWLACGAGGGGLCAWGYAKHQRATWFSVVLVTVGYLVAAVAGLLRAYNGVGQYWVTIQGLSSLLVGVGILVVLHRRRRAIGTSGKNGQEPPPDAQAEGPRERARRSPPLIPANADEPSPEVAGVPSHMSKLFTWWSFILVGLSIALPYIALILAELGRESRLQP